MAVLGECENARIAIDLVNKAVAEHDGRRLWFGLHGFVTATGNVSKLLWGQGATHNRRRARLRELLQVSNESILSDRDIRNDLEHFDDRLETWAKRTEHYNILDRFVGPVSAFGDLFGDLFGPNDCLRAYDPNAKTLTFAGNSLDIQAVTDALATLEPLARALAMGSSATILGGWQAPPTR